MRSVPVPSAAPSLRGSVAWLLAMGLAAAAAAASSPHLPVPVGVALGLAALLLLPGWLAVGGTHAADDLGPVGSLALAPAAGLMLWAVPLGLCFAAGLPLVAAAAMVVLLAALLAGRGRPPLPARGESLMLSGLAAAGALLGWRWQSRLVGDALFHAGVVRKLLALDGLSLRAIWPFADGHPHAGYAFPLLHAAQAAAIGLTPADPSLGYQDLVPAFAALVAVVAYATGRAVSGVAGGLATSLLALWVSVTGSQSLSVAQQPRYVVTLLLVPAVLLLLVEIVRRPAAPLRGLLVGTVVVITVLHSTYVPVILLMVTAVAVACPPLRRDVLVAAGSAAAVVGWIYLEALWGLHYRPPVPLAPLDFVVAGGHRIALSGVQVFERRPEYAIGLVVLAIALRRRSGALGVLGLAAAVAYVAAALPGSVLLAEQLFGAGQVQRYAEEIPWVYVLGAAAGELAGARAGMVAAAAVLGSLAIDRSGLLGTAAASALSMAGAVVLLALGVDRLRRGASRTPATATAGSAMAAVVVAVALVAGSVDGWGRVTLSSAQDGKPQPTVDDRLTPAALAFFRAHQAGMPVVLAPFSASFADWYSGISYQLTGMATVYTVAISAYHSESELRDDPAARRRAVTAFLDPATAETRRRRILARYGVAYVALDLRTASRQLVAALDRDSRLAVVFRDGRALPGHSRLEVWRVSAGG